MRDGRTDAAAISVAAAVRRPVLCEDGTLRLDLAQDAGRVMAGDVGRQAGDMAFDQRLAIYQDYADCGFFRHPALSESGSLARYRSVLV
jgi:hypothetical protein